jgi:hypothetical protein
MQEKCGIHDDCIGALASRIDAVKSDTDRIIVGMYGSLDRPNSGFAVEISSAIRDLKNGIVEINEKVNTLTGEWQDRRKDQKAFNWGVRLAVFSAILSVVGSIVVLMIGKII